MSAQIAVVGAGPAGLITAIHLARSGQDVTLIDRAATPCGPIGEQLSGQAVRELACLDARLVATRFGVPSPSTCSAWGESELHVRSDLFSVWGSSYIVERSALEQALAEVAQASGARFLRGERLQRVSESSDALRLTLDSGGVLEAAFIVDATGRSASVARQLGATQLRYDSLVALQGTLARTAVQRHPKGVCFAAHPEGACSLAAHEVLVESTSQGWWYSVRAPDGSLVAIYFTDREFLRLTGAEAVWRAALIESRHTRLRARDYGKRQAIEVRSACSQRLDHAAGDRWLAVGDAAMAWDPLSASGLHNAISEARHAADAIEAALAGDPEAVRVRYVERVRRAFASYLATRGQMYRSQELHAGSAFWQRRRTPASTDLTHSA